MGTQHTNQKKTVTIAHSPDADDRFMFWPIKESLIPTPPLLEFSFQEADTQTLNTLASHPQKGPHICAVSAIHYRKIYQHYQPLLMGTSLGVGYGPILVSKSPRTLSKAEKNPGVLLTPGLETTAHAVVQFLGYEFESIEVVPITPMERMFKVLEKHHTAGQGAVALLIHEGRLSYSNYGTHSLLDIGLEWKKHMGTSLPLGINVIRRDLPQEEKILLSQILKKSFDYALENRDTFIDICQRKSSPYFSPLTPEKLGAYLDLYANGNTRSLPTHDQQAFKALIQHKGGSDVFIPIDWI